MLTNLDPAFCLEQKTAPGQVFGVSYQSAFHWIHVHVRDFHTRYRQIPMMDEATGELIEGRLDHQSGGSGFATQDAAKIAGRADAKKIKNSRQPGGRSVGAIMVGQNAEKPTRQTRWVIDDGE